MRNLRHKTLSHFVIKFLLRHENKFYKICGRIYVKNIFECVNFFLIENRRNLCAKCEHLLMENLCVDFLEGYLAQSRFTNIVFKYCQSNGLQILNLIAFRLWECSLMMS